MMKHRNKYNVEIRSTIFEIDLKRTIYSRSIKIYKIENQ